MALNDEAKQLIRRTAVEALHMRQCLDEIDDRIEEIAQEVEATRNIASVVSNDRAGQKLIQTPLGN